ncbi:MAG: glucose-1-phosphate thymidylyltransferase RfbA, partial [Bacteroidota bacterium]
PMIYYPLSVLMIAGIREILIITTPQDQQAFKKLLGDGSEIGCKIEYAAQAQPNGLAEAFIIGEEFIGDDKVALILGDNIFFGHGLGRLLRSKTNLKGASIFAYPVEDPDRYGVVEFDESQKVISIEEKPKQPKSTFAVPGLYFYDNRVVEYAKQVEPSIRGEKEITSINQMYLEKQELEVGVMERGMAWLDTGTVEAMNDASEFVKVMEKRTGTKIACIEEIAYLFGYISKEEAIKLAEKYQKSGYGKHILKSINTL